MQTPEHIIYSMNAKFWSRKEVCMGVCVFVCVGGGVYEDSHKKKAVIFLCHEQEISKYVIKIIWIGNIEGK